MNSIHVEDNFLIIEIVGWWRKALSLKSGFKIPLSHVKNFVVGPEECDKLWKGFRIGANLPGVYTGGINS